MELQIQREKINIKKKIGEKNKTIVIEKDIILPDSKPDIIKVQTQNSNIYINKHEKMEGKIKVDGGVVTRVAYLTGEGKSKVLKIEESFNEVLEIEGVTTENYIIDSASVRLINVNILNERKIHYKVEIDYNVKVSKKEEIEYIYEINKSHNLQILTQKKTIDTFIGQDESKIGLKEKIETENLSENIEVVQITHNIRNIENKISYNKILVKADCELKCIYQTDSGQIFIAKKEVPIMGFLNIENIEETNQVSTLFSIKNININNIDNDAKTGINVEMEFNLIGEVYQSKEINVLTDLYDLNYRTEFTKRKMLIEKCNIVPMQIATVNQKIIVEEINQIYNAEYQIINLNQIEQELEVEIKAIYLYSSFENQTINKKEEIFKTTIQLENNGSTITAQISNNTAVVLPDSSINTQLEVQIFSNEVNCLELINEIKLNDEENDEGYSMVIYFVKPGDSLWKIAKKFKSTIKEISALNEISSEDKINVGEKLYIPRAI